MRRDADPEAEIDVKTRVLKNIASSKPASPG
jgi:hypothetical protein